MNVEKAIKLRQSVRKYSDKKIEEEKLMNVLEAARLAPSASNRQEWRFVTVKEAKIREELSRAANQQMVKEAPVVIVCCAETDGHLMSCGQKCYPIDVAIAIDHMTLQAAELGLGTCWVGAFNADEVKKIIDIPEDIEVVEMLVIGYPEGKFEIVDKPRLNMKEIRHKEKWGKH
ncbi:MAG: nitroreductase family protein [Elusimicrobia bacterium]|jgi:nitroreductase|nr:nitroreductase family protein [Elusimicrobiota bacterium]